VTLGSLASTAVSDLITHKGIGKGAEVVLLGGSSLVFLKQIAGVVARAPNLSTALVWIGWIVLGGIVVIVFTIYVMDSRRNIPIFYAKRVAPGNRGVPTAQLPLLLNVGRVIPVSAAIGLLALLQLSQSFFQSYGKTRAGAAAVWLTRWAVPANGWYWVAMSCLIVIFTYVYNYSVLWQDDTSLVDDLKKNSAFIGGVRPGANTEAYLTRVIRSISLPGGVGLAALAAGIPYAVLRLTQQNITVTMLSLLVVVITAQSLRDEVKVHHMTESYHGLFDGKPRKSLLDRL
jgi:preprotein translocase subunit SecY